MKVILKKFLTLCLFIVALGCFYLTFTMTFVSTFINFALFFIAIFFLIQACGMFDELQGYGQYSDEPHKEHGRHGKHGEIFYQEEQPLEQEDDNDGYNEVEMEDDDYSDYD